MIPVNGSSFGRAGGRLGRYRERQHLGYCPRVNPKLPRCFPSAQTLDLYRVTNPPIKLHHLHPPPSAITPKGYLLP